MARRESKELAKRMGGNGWPMVVDMDKCFENTLHRPFSLLKPLMRFSEMEEMMMVPSVDIFEDKSDVVVKAELPGIKKEDIDVTLTGGTITISGEKKMEEEVKRNEFYRCESSYGSFTPTFTLPSEVQSAKAKTKMNNGILEIRIPKTEEAKKKEVKVKIE